MILEEANRILALTGTEDRTEIKKRYRKLMHQVHPDAIGEQKPAYGFTAQQINAAYAFLMKQKPGAAKLQEASQRTSADSAGSRAGIWDAPRNPLAYTARNIYVENIRVASGKYYLAEEEDFHMFLRSIYDCSRALLEPFSEKVQQDYLGEIAYLLSQQFVDRRSVLERYEIEHASGDAVYYFPAMLETEGRRCLLAPGAVLVPQGVRNHRLYVSNAAGKEYGYLSFQEDLLYYALIPLFEQRRVQVKIRVSGSTTGNNNIRAVKVRTLDLWVRMGDCSWTQIERSLSDQIESLLQSCRNSS